MAVMQCDRVQIFLVDVDEVEKYVVGMAKEILKTASMQSISH